MKSLNLPSTITPEELKKVSSHPLPPTMNDIFKKHQLLITTCLGSAATPFTNFFPPHFPAPALWSWFIGSFKDKDNKTPLEISSKKL